MDSMYLRRKSVVNMRAASIFCLVLLTVMVGASLQGAAQKYNEPALEWTLPDGLPGDIEVDEEFTVTVTLTNEGNVDLIGGNKTTVEITSKGITRDKTVIEVRKGQSSTVTFHVRLNTEGSQDLKLNSYYRTIPVALYHAGQKTATLGTVDAKVVEEPINWLPIVAVVVIAALGAGAYFFVNKRKKEAEEERRLAEEARRQEVIRKKEEEIAKKIEVKQIVGKQPRDYYILRRSKYATLKPAGMTSSGLTILRRQKTKQELEEERKIVCPKCGTDLPAKGAECPRCLAVERIEAVRHTVRSYKSTADVDFTDAEVLLRKAEHRLNWSDFAMANEIVAGAEAKTEEIWAAAEVGEVLASTVVEYSEVKGPSLDAKVIGMEGEEVAMPSQLDMTRMESRPEAEPSGEACPECGNIMDDGVCLLCTFEEKMNSCWSLIEEGELDGAEMSEAKDLCRQAKSAHERDADELAIRYLRRAIGLSGSTFHTHVESKTVGIIEFTKALIDQLKSLGEDVSVAEAMLVEADAAMASGDYETARSLATKADGYLKQMKEDSYRKQIAELLPQVEAGAASNPQVKELLQKAKRLIEAKELEGAADVLEVAKSRM